jgi:glycosyltransferase involved in cell wall biosynthesis
MKKKISYAITVCNEFDETIKLVTQLLNYKGDDSEMVILLDTPKAQPELIEYLEILAKSNKMTLIESEFDNDFAQWKNFLNSHCTGEWIFQIDADEMLDPNLIINLETILSDNSDKDLIFVPRINIVHGITEAHTKLWNWPITKMDSMTANKQFERNSDAYAFLHKLGYIIDEQPTKSGNIAIVTYYMPINCFPDVQTRLYKNIPERIGWIGRVHEKIVGFESYTVFPTDEMYCLLHIKDIEKQERQNSTYDRLQKKIDE